MIAFIFLLIGGFFFLVYLVLKHIIFWAIMAVIFITIGLWVLIIKTLIRMMN